MRSSLYAVDEQAVASAIVLRSQARLLLPAEPFRSAQRTPVRSFRRDAAARSFRLSSSLRRRSD